MSGFLVESDRVGIFFGGMGGEPETASWKRVQWTQDGARNQHLYFTSPSVTLDDRYLIILREEREGEVQVVRIDRRTGELQAISGPKRPRKRAYCYPEALSDGLNKASVCLDAERGIVYFERDDAFWRVGADGVGLERLADFPEASWGAFTAVTADGRYLLAPVTSIAVFPDNLQGQGRQMEAVSRFVAEGRVKTRILKVDTESGEVVEFARLPFWVTHVQDDPAGSGRIVFNAEGHWQLQRELHPRVWLLEPDGSSHPLFDQPPDEQVGHENWLPDGSGILYHGYVLDSGKNRPFVAVRDAMGRLRKQIVFGDDHLGYGHYIATPDPDRVLADAGDSGEIREVFLGLAENSYAEKLVGHHGGQIVGGDQDSHVHPVATPRGVCFTAFRQGRSDVFEFSHQTHR